MRPPPLTNAGLRSVWGQLRKLMRTGGPGGPGLGSWTGPDFGTDPVSDDADRFGLGLDGSAGGRGGAYSEAVPESDGEEGLRSAMGPVLALGDDASASTGCASEVRTVNVTFTVAGSFPTSTVPDAGAAA